MASWIRECVYVVSTLCMQAANLSLSLISTCLTWTTDALLSKSSSAPGTKPRYDSDRQEFPEPSIADEPETYTLPDGRQLGFSRYGAESIKTLFYLHGLPDSRLGAGIFDEPARNLGLRIIGVDRPGVGLSSPCPNRSYLSNAADIRALAKHLELGGYGIIGISGGGPYALACAHELPRDQLKSVTLVAGFGSLSDSKDMKFGNKVLFYGYRYAPWLVRYVVAKAQGAMLRMDDDKIMTALEKVNTYHRFRWPKPKPKDAQTFHQNKALFKWLVYGSREFFKQGYDAFMEECRLLTGSLGFEIEDIREDLPVQMWYGKQDTNVPLQMGEKIAVRLGGRAAFHVEDETHVSLWLNQRERILEELARCL